MRWNQSLFPDSTFPDTFSNLLFNRAQETRSPGGTNGKTPPLNAGRCNKLEFDPWVRKIPWRRKWEPTPVLLPGESHGQRNLVGCSPQGHTESDVPEVTQHTLMYKTQGGPGVIHLQVLLHDSHSLRFSPFLLTSLEVGAHSPVLQMVNLRLTENVKFPGSDVTLCPLYRQSSSSILDGRFPGLEE